MAFVITAVHYAFCKKAIIYFNNDSLVSPSIYIEISTASSQNAG